MKEAVISLNYVPFTVQGADSPEFFSVKKDKVFILLADKIVLF